MAAAYPRRISPPCHAIKHKLRLFMPRSRTSGQGRPKGVPNKATADIKALAQPYGPAAIALLAEMAGLVPGTPAEPDAVRVAAIRELLDRGFGKSTQLLAGDADGPPLQVDFRWADALPHPAPESDEAVEDAAGGILVTFAADPSC